MNPSTSLARCGDQSTADDLMDDWLFLSSGSEVLEVSRDGQEVDGQEADGQEAEDRGKIKSKLLSAWNSVKYGQL